jgi:hypothetical protein
MLHLIMNALYRCAPSLRPIGMRKSASIRFRPRLEALEDRTTPATSLAPPTFVDPLVPVQVDQSTYTLKGTLQQVAKNGAMIEAFRDSNQNGVYDAGVDARVASAAIAKGGKTFSLPVTLQQDSANQFFLIAVDGKLRSAPAKAPLIIEDSTAPTVTGITRMGTPLTNAGSVEFRVNFSENVTGVDATDFEVVPTGSVSSGRLSVAGSGKSYTVTVDDLFGDGTLGLSLMDDNTIRDLLTDSSQAHPLGGPASGDGSFTASELYANDRSQLPSLGLCLRLAHDQTRQ